MGSSAAVPVRSALVLHLRPAALVVAAAFVLTACASTEPGATKGTTAPLPGGTVPGSPVESFDESLDWSECGDRLECASIEVPLVHADPAAATITLPLMRHLAGDADERIGTLLVNPGGPGVGGLFLAEFADQIYDEVLLERFDILAWDPRGVGGSEPPVECVDELDPFFSIDPTADTEAERAALDDIGKEFAEACATNTSEGLLANISTRDAAMDMDLIRRSLGEETISYFGFSYGSELGATWATLYPDTVRAAVLDSASAPNADGAEQAVEDAVALERVFTAFLNDCADDPSCAFHSDGNPASAFTDLMAALEQDPLEVDPDRPAVNEAIALFAVISALYDSESWPDLARQLDEARDGDGAGLLDAYDQYLLRNPDGTYGNEFEALLAINCLDQPGPTDHAAVDERNDAIEAAAPLLGRFESLPYVCADWPVRRAAPPVDITGKGAGPIMVIGATGDPVTSIESSAKMAAALEEGFLVTVDAAQHTVYGVDDCGDDAVHDYLIDLVVPADDLVCD